MIWFLKKDDEFKFLENFSFNMILNLANVCNAESSEILWGFIENYYNNIKRDDFPMIQELLNYGVEYYNKFVLPNKKYRKPNELETVGFKKIIGMDLKFENLRDWFSAFYQVVLGQDQGPRLGSFIKLYGIKKTINLLEQRLN